MYKIIGADQKEYGPVGADEIRQWIAEGRANGQTPVHAEGAADWKPLSSFPEFAAALAVSPSAALPPPPILSGDNTSLPYDILARDYDLDIGGCVNQSWALISNNFGLVVGGVALFILVQFAVGFLGIIPILGALISLASIFAAGPFMGGVYFFLLKVIRGRPAAIGDVFSGFGPRFLHLMLVYLVMMLGAVLLAIPGGVICGISLAGMIRQHEPDALGIVMATAGFFLLVIPIMYVMTCWMFSLPLVIDKQLDFWPAMETSRKVVNKHWWKMFAFVIVCALINFAGACACYVGMFISLPLVFGATMYAYENIFGQRAAPKT